MAGPTKLDIYSYALRHLADARLALVSDDVESRYELDSAWPRAVPYVLGLSGWRFALKTAALATGGSAMPGYTTSYALPSDCLLVHAVFRLGGTTTGRECPLDFREQGANISANFTGAQIRYVSSTFIDPAVADWPEKFAQVVAAYLAFLVSERVTGERGSSGRMSQLFSSLLPAAQKTDAVADNVWLPYQRSGALLTAVRQLLTFAPWRFALIDAAISTPTGTPAQGFSHSYDKPPDWLQTHRLFLTTGIAPECPFDVRETNGFWSSNQSPFVARYVSTAGIDSTLWPPAFEGAVLAYLDAGMPDMDEAPQAKQGQETPRWQQALAAATAVAAEPVDILLSHQFDGSLAQGARDVLAQGTWRFATANQPLVLTTPPHAGYAKVYSLPVNHLRTLALFQLSPTGRHCPFDVTETGAAFHANPTPGIDVQCRYISKAAAIAPVLWPQSFIETLRAWFRWRQADAQSAPGLLKLYEVVRDNSLLGDGEEPDPWLAFQLSGAFARVSRTMTDEAYWRFAMVTIHITAPSGPGDGGYAHAYAIPSDWSRTRQLYRLAPDGRRMPFDVREAGMSWHTDAAEFYAQYISDELAGDATQWPDHYMRATLRQLQFDEDVGDTEPGEEGEGTKEAQITAPAWKDALAATTDSEADEPDPWLAHQLTGAFRRAKYDVIDTGFWRWALKEVQYVAEVDQLPDAADYIMPFTFLRPDNWYRTHALFVPWDGQDCPINAREVGSAWTTDAPSFVARYVTTEALDETTWPEPVAKAVLARLEWVTAPPEKATPLAAVYAQMLADAQAIHARPPDEWLRFQIDGSFRQACKMLLEEGRWRFAVRTVTLTESSDPLPDWLADGTPSDGYRYRFIQPNDNLRTISLYYRQGDASYSVMNTLDFRDEGDSYSANYTPIVVRYVSRLGFDSTKWSPHFRNALLAWLQYNEARADPRMAPVAAERYKAYELACAEAQKLDDERDIPQRRYSGRFVRGRYGRGTLDFENAWPPLGTL